MKRLFVSVWQWLFGNKKGVEITTPLQKPTMNIVRDEPKEDKVEAILTGNAPEPQFMDVEGSNEILEQQEPKIDMVEEKGSYEPLKFDVVKGDETYSLTEKQYFFYITISKNNKILGVDICKAYLAFKNPNGIPENLPRWHYDVHTHRGTIAYLTKIGLIKKVGKLYSIK